MESKPFKSRRAIEAEVVAYQRKRFEDYMQEVDAGQMTQELALLALRDEIEYREVCDGKREKTAN